MSDSSRHRAEQLAASYIERGDPIGWFERVYDEAEGDCERIPWADMHPNPWLEPFLKRELPMGPVLVVGCGLGDDAEVLAARNYTVTAFDISDACVAWCKKRFPDSSVGYEKANLLELPKRYERGFGFVVEMYTVQSLPLNIRTRALKNIAKCVAPDGTLLLVARGREDNATPSGPPWAVARSDLAVLESAGLSLQRFEDFFDDEDPPKRRFVAVYRRSGPTPPSSAQPGHMQ